MLKYPFTKYILIQVIVRVIVLTKIINFVCPKIIPTEIVVNMDKIVLLIMVFVQHKLRVVINN
jgi:hypothetical protein